MYHDFWEMVLPVRVVQNPKTHVVRIDRRVIQNPKSDYVIYFCLHSSLGNAYSPCPWVKNLRISFDCSPSADTEVMM